MPKCECVIVNRDEDESQREWLKRCMCMHHWTQTDYYRDKLVREPNGTLRLHLADTNTYKK